MATHDWFNIPTFWDDEYKQLDYQKEEFNDPLTVIKWQDAGFRGPFGGCATCAAFNQVGIKNL
jgi:hypothetical protein